MKRFVSRAASWQWAWLLAVLLFSVQSAAAQALPELPECADNDSDHHRWGMKTRPRPSDGPDETPITVARMLTWRVPLPDQLPEDARTSDEPITRLEREGAVYALTGFVRLVKWQADCDFHVQVASSREEKAPQVIIEIPNTQSRAQRRLMSFVDMKDNQQSKRLSGENAVRLTFVGYAFLDQTHQREKKPTQEGFGHGPAGVVRTLWELHPVWEVREPE